MVIQIKARTGDIIFEYDKENNTIKDTVEEAVKNGVSLVLADLSRTNLAGADLEGALLKCANLIGADLYRVNLKDAILIGADLCCADLNCANLEGAKLEGVDFRFAKNIPNSVPMACPESGSFIGWKKVFDHGAYLIKLEIPVDAKRSSATSKKCRCSKAKVLKITNIETNKNVKEIYNFNFVGCMYRVGEMVYPDLFDKNRWNECSHGIHFFMNKQDAIDY